MHISDALTARRSCRAFKPDPVSRVEIEAILDMARRSPSGGNMQPWKVIAVAGEARQAVTDLAVSVFAEHPRGQETDYPAYPDRLWEPYRERRFAIGEAMYDTLGIAREDKAGRFARFAENYNFFGAPCALFFVLDERFGHAQWAHMGMFIMCVAMAAQERGLDSCMQECWSVLRPALNTHFELGETEMVYCGLPLGYADDSHPTAALRSPRESVGTFTEYHGW